MTSARVLTLVDWPRTRRILAVLSDSRAGARTYNALFTEGVLIAAFHRATPGRYGAFADERRGVAGDEGDRVRHRRTCARPWARRSSGAVWHETWAGAHGGLPAHANAVLISETGHALLTDFRKSFVCPNSRVLKLPRFLPGWRRYLPLQLPGKSFQ